MKKSEPLLAAYFPLTDHKLDEAERGREEGEVGSESDKQLISPVYVWLWWKKTAISSFFLTFHSRLCTDRHCAA